MKIKSIKLENNEIFDDFYISFTNDNGDIVDTIILAGENGCGKTTLLDLIYNFSQIKISGSVTNEKRIFEVFLNEYELNFLLEHENIKSQLKFPTGDFKITQDFSKQPNYWNRIIVEYYSCCEDNNVWLKIDTSVLFGNIDIKALFKSIYSTVEINYFPKPIKTVTAEDIDQKINESKKSDEDIATKIKQIFIDISTNDAEELDLWVDENPGITPPEVIKKRRIKRFKKAFSYIFNHLYFKCIKNIDGNKEVIFFNNGKEIPISSLSSGEKQIVFRGGFLLKDIQSIKGCVALIDEPEISLHPKWQKNILDFYKQIFTDEAHNQTSQIFVATHSPFIIHNDSRYNDIVIILKKDDDGKIHLSDKPTFDKVGDIDIVNDAFNINDFKISSAIEAGKNIIITEGKTDWKHLKNAYEYYKLQVEYKELNIAFLEYEHNMGDTQLETYLKKLVNDIQGRRMIGVYDNDCDNI